MSGRVGGGGSGGGGSSGSTKPFYIQNTETFLVLEVKQEKGPEVVMQTYTAARHQLWEYKKGMIYSKLNGLVLDVKNDSVCIFVPNGGPSQLWRFEGDGTIRNKFGLVMDVFEARTEDWTPVIAYPKHGGPNQIFRIVTIEGNGTKPEAYPGEPGTLVKALCDYKGTESNTLSFRKGDVFEKLIDWYQPGWSKGIKDGRAGVYPSSFVKVVFQ